MSASPNWSCIADDMLIYILARLHTLHDVFAVRAVCRNWRSVAIDASLSPLLVIIRNDDSHGLLDFTHRRVYSLRFPWTISERYITAYSHPHLITTATKCGEANIHLWNIYTRAQTILPPTGGFLYRIRASPTGQLLLLEGLPILLKYLNLGDASWTVLDSPNIPKIRDMIFFQGEWLVLTKDMELHAVELRGQSLIVRESWGGGLADNWESWNLGLGESDGVLFVVRRNGNNISDYNVFQWDSVKKVWEETRDVGDKALFVSHCGGLVLISATQLGLRKNCVYWANHKAGSWDEFSLEDRSCVVVNHSGVLPVCTLLSHLGVS